MSDSMCFKPGCYIDCPHKCDWKVGRVPGYQEQEEKEKKEKAKMSNFLRLVLHK